MNFNVGASPGMQATIQTQENQVWSGHENLRILDTLPILKSTAIDAGNTPTTQLRSGLVLGKRDSDGLWAEYDPTQTDGREVARGVLIGSLSMLNAITGAAEDKHGGVYEVMTGGNVKAAALFGLDGLARVQMAKMFNFDDELAPRDYGGPWLREVAKAANYVVTAADNLTEFVATAAAGVVFTLPAIAKGLRFKFRNEANAAMGVAAPAAILIGLNSVTLTSVTFSTAGQMIGAGVIVYANKAGTKWVVEQASCPGTTITATWA